MSTTQAGHDAEQRVAEFLQSSGHSIIARNWRTRWCEIDIVSTAKKTVYFTEVKYRSSDAWGDGTEYVGRKKQRQMQFAAEFWLHDNNWKGEAQMLVASVSVSDDIEFFEV